MNQQTLSETTTLPRSSTARIRRVEAVVNIAGGSVETRAAEGLEALVSEFGLEVHVASAEPRDIEATVRRAVSADPDLVIILAGMAPLGLRLNFVDPTARWLRPCRAEP
jgi:hypothetical protein